MSPARKAKQASAQAETLTRVGDAARDADSLELASWCYSASADLHRQAAEFWDDAVRRIDRVAVALVCVAVALLVFALLAGAL